MITFSNANLSDYGHTVTQKFFYSFHTLTYSQFKSPTLPPLHPGPVLPLLTRPDHPCGFCIDWYRSNGLGIIPLWFQTDVVLDSIKEQREEPCPTFGTLLIPCRRFW
jgi:hypothetical protein